MCAETMLALLLALAALNAERIYQKEQSDVRRFNTEIHDRKLAADDSNNCASAGGLACKSFHNITISEQSANSQAHEAARDKTPR